MVMCRSGEAVTCVKVALRSAPIPRASMTESLRHSRVCEHSHARPRCAWQILGAGSWQLCTQALQIAKVKEECESFLCLPETRLAIATAGNGRDTSLNAGAHVQLACRTARPAAAATAGVYTEQTTVAPSTLQSCSYLRQCSRQAARVRQRQCQHVRCEIAHGAVGHGSVCMSISEQVSRIGC